VLAWAIQQFVGGVELEDGDGVVLLAWTKYTVSPSLDVTLVGRIGIMLGLEADAGALLVLDALLAGNGTIEEVARINLYARFGSAFNKDDAALGAHHDTAEWEVGDIGRGSHKYPVVVISVAEFNLLVVGVDVLTDEFHAGLAAFGHKAERITGLEFTELACGDELVVDGGHLVGKDDQRIFGNAVVGVTTEVEI